MLAARARVTPRPAVLLSVLTLAVGLAVVPAVLPGSASATERPASSEIGELTMLADPERGDGATLVVAPPDRPLARPPGIDGDAAASVVALAHLRDLAPLLDVSTGAASLATGVVDDAALTGGGPDTTDLLGPVVRFDQLVDGVPVYGGGLVVALDDDGRLRSVGGQTTAPRDVTFSTPASSARATALAAASARLRVPAAALTVGVPRQFVYDPELFGEAGAVLPVWRVHAGIPRSAARVEVLVSAVDGRAVSVTGGTAQLRRAVCDAYEYDGIRDVSYASDAAYGWCGEVRTNIRYRDTSKDGRLSTADSLLDLSVLPARSEGGAAVGPPDVDAAYASLGHTSTLFQALGVDLTNRIAPTAASINVPGGGTPRTLAGVVGYCDPVESYYSFPFNYGRAERAARDNCPFGNAFWYGLDEDWLPGDGAYPGGQMFIGRGMAGAVDVIAHELTHGVTSQVNGLIYRGQPGAINESMSDVFGQLAQVYAAPGTDSAWLMGEQLNGPRIFGAIRSMSNPSAGLGAFDGRQPDRMSSVRWDEDWYDQDSGGVHTNSGVGNKAAYLIARGGRFNGVTVRALDTLNPFGSKAATLKTAQLYWMTQRLLPSSASYRTLGQTLVVACQQLVGSHGFVASDCTGSVARAATATQMTTTKVKTKVSRTSLRYGKKVTVTARVTDARGGRVGSTPMRLERRIKGRSWTAIATGTTSSGAKRWKVKPKATARYRVATVPLRGSARTVGPVRRTVVKARVKRTVAARTISFGSRVRVRGKVAPQSRGKVRLQQRVEGRWRNASSDRLSRKSKFKLRYRPRSTVDRTFRVYRPSTRYRAAGVSAKFRIRVL